MDGRDLIDKAVRLGFSLADIAEHAGVDPAYISRVRSGKQAISAATAVLIADMAGEDTDDALRRATVATEKNPARKAALSRVLFNLAIWCAAAGLGLGVTESAHSQTLTLADSLYIVLCLVLAWLASQGPVLRR